MENKIYVILDDCVWSDESLTDVIAVSDNEQTAKELFKDYIEKLKKEINFDELNAIKDYDFDYQDYDNQWVYSESDDNFSLFLVGEYNSNHINVNIEVRSLNKQKMYEVDL